MNKRHIKTINQARRIKNIDNVIFDGELMKAIVDELRNHKHD